MCYTKDVADDGKNRMGDTQMAVAELERTDTDSGTKNRNVISLRLPDNIAEVANAAAEAAELRLSRWALKIICDSLGVDVPKASRTRATKYTTMEERVAARKASTARRTDRIKNSLELLKKFEQFQKGEITMEQFTSFQANGVAA